MSDTPTSATRSPLPGDTEPARTHYHHIAGQSLHRIAGLSDGLFAVAMTLLVLDLHVPVSEAIHSEHALGSALLHLSPSFLAYFMSFVTLGIFWVGQQTQLTFFARSDRHLTWIHLGFLLLVALTPFSTALLAEYITSRPALVIYWLNIFVLGALLYASLRYAARAGLMDSEMDGAAVAAAERRVVIAQSLYAFATLLCVINTYVSIVVIVLVQLNYAIAPKIRGLDRL